LAQLNDVLDRVIGFVVCSFELAVGDQGGNGLMIAVVRIVGGEAGNRGAKGLVLFCNVL